MLRNTASQKLTLLAIDTSTNTPKTGDAANLTAYESLDDGAVTVLGDTSATELDATNAPGLYSFDLTQGETNGTKILFSGKSSTANIKLIPLLAYTLPAGFTGYVAQTGDAYARIGANGASLTDLATQASVNTIDDFLDTEIAAILAAVDTEVAAIIATLASGVALTAAERNAVADALLARNVAGGSSTGRTVKQAFYALRNRVAISAGTMTVYQVDDSTSDWTAAVTTAAGNPLSEIDPG